LDYRVIAAIKAQEPKLYASFILPYDIVFPQTKANAYTMEYTTLDVDFISQAQDQGKEVWAWTVDSWVPTGSSRITSAICSRRSRTK
jgi:glycerophosphoryl diester phosphodiesterase